MAVRVVVTRVVMITVLSYGPGQWNRFESCFANRIQRQRDGFGRGIDCESPRPELKAQAAQPGKLCQCVPDLSFLCRAVHGRNAEYRYALRFWLGRGDDDGFSAGSAATAARVTGIGFFGARMAHGCSCLIAFKPHFYAHIIVKKYIFQRIKV